MSAILAVCGDAFCVMVSDGRYVEEPITGDKPHIISDELPKVRKVNRNVLVGFAGDTLAAVQIINALDQYDVRYLTLEGRQDPVRESPRRDHPARGRAPAGGRPQPQGSVCADHLRHR